MERRRETGRGQAGTQTSYTRGVCPSVSSLEKKNGLLWGSISVPPSLLGLLNAVELPQRFLCGCGGPGAVHKVARVRRCVHSERFSSSGFVPGGWGAKKNSSLKMRGRRVFWGFGPTTTRRIRCKRSAHHMVEGTRGSGPVWKTNLRPEGLLGTLSVGRAPSRS